MSFSITPSVASSSTSRSPSPSRSDTMSLRTSNTESNSRAVSPGTASQSSRKHNAQQAVVEGPRIATTDRATSSDVSSTTRANRLAPTVISHSQSQKHSQELHNPSRSASHQSHIGAAAADGSGSSSSSASRTSHSAPHAGGGGASISNQSLINGLPSSALSAARTNAAAVASSSTLRANSLGAFDATPNVGGHSIAMYSPAGFPFIQPFQTHASHQHALQAQSSQQQHQHMSIERFTAELTNCIIAFLSPILPTEEEYRIKEATRRQLERLAGKVSPGAKLLAFGSMANGFALKNSDMDLCLIESEMAKSNNGSLNASELVEALGKILRDETDYTVMPLPRARIPIIKISRPPTPELPYDIACDIGFENRLALENTRLLLSYAMVDPPRLRTLVLFLKVWTKRRKLNSPYTGTLSSYGYTLMMLFFLMHVKRPAVLPNLQRIPPSSSSSCKQDANLNGHSIYFYDDVATLRKEWSSQNSENVGELLLDFFRYFSKEFSYSRDVISIRSEYGVFPKDGKTWSAELCIEDPFQSGYNVSRTVTKDGLYTIRGEFIRALRILTTRMNRVSAALAELCEEREDGLTRAPEPSHYHRQRHAGAPPTFLNPGLYLPSGGFDPRYLRDLTRRIEATSHSPGGYGGSFAFEEMARGLAQAQHGGQAVAYPPTTAMLAPLSQNVGLSPQQSLMRAGLRYDTAQRGQSIASGMSSSFANVGGSIGNSNAAKNNPGLTIASLGAQSANHRLGNASVPSTPRISSSARSVDGGASSYGRRKSKRWNANAEGRAALDSATSAGTSSGNISAQTSPRLGHAVPQTMAHRDASMNGAYGIGEAFAYGSEISFGSQRFHLYPQHSVKQQSHNQSDDRTGASGQQSDKSSNNMLSPSSAAFPVDAQSAQRNSRSFSDGLSRSKSLPRQQMNPDRRSSTPALSEPPSSALNAVETAADAIAVKDVIGVSPGPHAPQQTTAEGGVRSILIGRAAEASARREGAKRLSSVSQSSRVPSAGSVPLVGANGYLASQSANGSPYLTASPWSFYAPVPQNGVSSYIRGEDEAFALLDDDDDEEGVSLSDGTLDELARASAVESSTGGSDQCVEQVDGKLSHDEEEDDDEEDEDASGSSKKRHTIRMVRNAGSTLSPTNGVTEMADSGKEQDIRSWAASQRRALHG